MFSGLKLLSKKAMAWDAMAHKLSAVVVAVSCESDKCRYTERTEASDINSVTML